MTERNSEDEEFIRASFAALPRVEPSATLLRRVAEIPIQHPRTSRTWTWPFATVWRPALGWSLAGALGILTGVFSGESAWLSPLPLTDAATLAENVPTETTSELDALAQSNDGLEEFLALAWGSELEDSREY